MRPYIAIVMFATALIAISLSALPGSAADPPRNPAAQAGDGEAFSNQGLKPLPPIRDRDHSAISGITPSGGQQIWGDVDCKGAAPNEVATRDSQAILRNVLEQNPLSQDDPCPDIGQTVMVDGVERMWGDVDCKGDAPNEVATRDSQAVLRYVLEQNPLSQDDPCPGIGQTVDVGGGGGTPPPTSPPTNTPTPVATATPSPTSQPTATAAAATQTPAPSPTASQPPVTSTPTPTVAAATTSPTPPPLPQTIIGRCWMALISFELAEPDSLSGSHSCYASSSPTYTCFFSEFSSFVDCSSSTYPYYSCYFYSFLNNADCDTLSSGYPDYDCWGYTFLNSVDCSTYESGWPDYSCYAYAFLLSVSCNPNDFSFPSFVCDYQGAGNWQCY